jgi:hypothetical protein
MAAAAPDVRVPAKTSGTATTTAIPRLPLKSSPRDKRSPVLGRFGDCCVLTLRPPNSLPINHQPPSAAQGRTAVVHLFVGWNQSRHHVRRTTAPPLKASPATRRRARADAAQLPEAAGVGRYEGQRSSSRVIETFHSSISLTRMGTAGKTAGCSEPPDEAEPGDGDEQGQNSRRATRTLAPFLSIGTNGVTSVAGLRVMCQRPFLNVNNFQVRRAAPRLCRLDVSTRYLVSPRGQIG